MLPKAPAEPRRSRLPPLGWIVVMVLTGLNLCAILVWFFLSSHAGPAPAPGSTETRSDTSSTTTSLLCPAPSCLDALILFHEDDRRMLIDNGGLEAAMKHLVGIRTFFVLSASNARIKTYLDAPDSRVKWINERRAPFSRRDFEGAPRPPGWLFQQALKLWAVAHVPELCNDVMVLDSDILWLREFDVRATVHTAASAAPAAQPPAAAGRRLLAAGGTGGCPPPQRYKYCLSSMDSGAWYGDITNGEYHHFVNWFTGMPKQLADTHTGINNWQVMQRDVVRTLEDSLRDRGLKDIPSALQRYSKANNGMSEYEAYFSFVWARYRERVEPVYLPWILRKPSSCDFRDAATMQLFHDKSSIMYFTCHDNYGADDYYINCKGREKQCDPKLAG